MKITSKHVTDKNLSSIYVPDSNRHPFFWRNSIYNLCYHTPACWPLLNTIIIVTAIKPGAQRRMLLHQLQSDSECNVSYRFYTTVIKSSVCSPKQHYLTVMALRSGRNWVSRFSSASPILLRFLLDAIRSTGLSLGHYEDVPKPWWMAEAELITTGPQLKWSGENPKLN